MAIQIELNGEMREVSQGQTLQDLVSALELTGQALAIAVNRQVVPKQQWEKRKLQSADRVEVVRAIGGG